MHEINLSVEMPWLDPELGEGCLKVQKGTMRCVRRTASGTHVLAKRRSLVGVAEGPGWGAGNGGLRAERSLVSIGSLGSFRGLGKWRERKGTLDGDEGVGICEGAEEE